MSASASPDAPATRRTLRGRVSLLGLAVIAGWVIVLTTIFNIVYAARLHNEVDVVLRTRAATAAATVIVSKNATITVRDNIGDEALDSGIWVYAGTRAVERPAGSPHEQAEADSLAGHGESFATEGDARFFVLPVRSGGTQIGTVVASTSTEPYEHARTEALVGSLLLAALMLLGAYPVLRLAAGRALRPVATMTDQAAEWSTHAVTQRFGPDQRFREMQTLAVTLDGVLDRLAAIVRHERDLSAELSHELRTPLSRIMAEADLLLARGGGTAEQHHALRSIHDSAVAMEEILESLFATARTELRDAPGRCDAREVVDSVTRTSMIDTIEVRVDVPAGLAIGVDAPVVQRILAPLLDNARRYASQRVTVTAQRTPDGVALDVTDDGPGVAEGQWEDVFLPGRRGSVDDGHDGAGLGLALSRRLARAASGDVIIVAPGSRFRVCLPPA